MRRHLALAFLAAAPLAADPLALADGEALKYRVSYGIFAGAGEIVVSAKTETNDKKPCLVVTTTTRTGGFVRGVYAFDARADSVFEARTGRLLVHTEASDSGKKRTNTALEFDYAKRTAKFSNLMKMTPTLEVPVPAGPDPMDLITSLVQTRTWDLKPGEHRDANVIFEEEIYQLTVHALRYEEVRTPLGQFNTLVLEPRMEKTPPQGMFKRGSKVHVWISQDGQRLPVKFEVEFKFGAGVATLVAHEPPPKK